MTHTLFALYHHPDDVQAFDQHYEETHSKLGLAFPQLRSFTGTHPGPLPDGQPAPFYFIAVLGFETAEALNAALSGPEGQAAIADLANFAAAGVTLINGPTTTYL